MPPGLVSPPPRPPLSSTTTTTAIADSSSDINRRTRGERPDGLNNLFRSSTSGGRSVLPPLPHDRSVVRSSSPRHHSVTPAALMNSVTNTAPLSSSPLSESINPTPARRRPQPGSARRSSLRISNVELPSAWPDDTLDLSSHDLDFDEQYLSILADGDFSSPSSYPSFTNPAAARGNDHGPAPETQASAPTVAASAPRYSRIPNFTPTAASRSATQLTASTSSGNSQNSSFSNDLYTEDSLFIESPSSSFSENMPTTRKRSAVAAGVHHNAAPPTKRRRTSSSAARHQSQHHSPQTARQAPIKNFDDIFGESPERSPEHDDLKLDELPTIDLTEANEVPQELLKPEVDSRVKISAFQCAICMDNVTALTVTHCGHLYCAQCLHMSLHVEATKGRCPMCRSKIDIKPRGSYTAKTKGFWPLELKLMTATRKGKQKAETIK